MKQKDIALIAVVVFMSVVISLIVSQYVFASPKNRQQNVEVVDSISAVFPPTDDRYFNPQAIDPTKLIKIGDSNNQAPFNAK